MIRQSWLQPLLACIAALAGALTTGQTAKAETPSLQCMDASTLRAAAQTYRLTEAEVTVLTASPLCSGTRSVLNGTLRWSFLIVRGRDDPERILWYAPHTNETVAFNSAVAGVVRHGGTLVAVRTADGARCLNGQDPNRAFGTLQAGGDSCGGGSRCQPVPIGQQPPFTAEVLRWLGPGAPIIGLHTNLAGFDDGAGCPHSRGNGNITAACSRGSLTVLPADRPARGASPDDTMVYVAAAAEPSQALGSDPVLAAIVSDLRRLRTNVVFERVGRTDCSLSNYAVQNGLPRYFNVEVEASDRAGQAAIIDDLVGILQQYGVLAARRQSVR